MRTKPSKSTGGIFQRSRKSRDRKNSIITDCRSTEGIAIGLVDGIITQARILKRMNFNSIGMEEALKDLRSDEDIAWLLNYEQ